MMGLTVRRCVLPVLCAFGMLVSASLCTAQGRKPLPPFPGQSSRPIQSQPVGPLYMKIRVEDNQVTAEIRNTPLQTVLEELANRTGVVFEIQSQEDPPISISLYHVGLQEAIQRIISSENGIFYYGQDNAGLSRIEYVRVFPRANEPQQPSLRYIGTGAVTKSGDDTVDTPEQALKALAESKSLEVRQKAVELLVKAKEDVAIQALTSVLDDPAPEIMAAAIEGLASLSARSSLPGIINALKDKHPGVRQSAINAVALLGDSENVKDLKPLSRDGDASVAAAAEIAIRKLSSTRHP
jgi:hypothetical protein